MKHQRRVAPGVLPENRVLGLGQAESQGLTCGAAPQAWLGLSALLFRARTKCIKP